MFNIIRHCENERAKNTIEYKRFKTGTNDPTITRRKRFAELMKSSKTARIHNFQERLSQGTIFVASQGQHADDYPSYRYASGQIYTVPINETNRRIVETENNTNGTTTTNGTETTTNGTTTTTYDTSTTTNGTTTTTNGSSTTTNDSNY